MADWLSPASITGIWSALASTAAAVIAWRVFAWQRKSSAEVVVTCEIAPAAKDPDWLILSLTVRNLTSTDWKLEELAFRPATSAKGVSFSSGGSIDRFGGREFDSVTAHYNASSPVPLCHRVASAGTQRNPMGGTWSEVTTENVYLDRASIRSAKLSMRLSLLSMDAVQRRIVIAITRELPPPMTAAAR